MIFLTGPHGAGKTAVAKMVARYNFDYVDLGGILREVHQRQNPEISFASWCRKGEEAHGSFFTDNVIVEEIMKRREKVLKTSSAIQDLIIVGSRSFGGIQYIIQRVPPFGTRKNVIVYVDAPEEILRERYCEREGTKLNPEEFGQLLDKDNQIGLAGIRPHADINILNSGSEKELVEKTRRVILAGLGYSLQ